MSTAATPPPRRASRLPFVFAAVVALLGVFAPVLANDVPLLARVQGKLALPAFVDLLGAPPPGPGDHSWAAWVASLPADGADYAVMPPWPHGPTATDAAHLREGPSFAHPMGTDDTGRDVLARVLHGTSAFVWLALPSVLLGGLVGTVLGALAGMRRGLVEVVVLRLIELFACFPMLLFLLFAASMFGDHRVGLVLVMAAVYWTSFARIVRGELLGLCERDWVHVARGLGLGDRRLFTHHLLPQLASSIGVTAAFCAASASVAESTLAFLGLGSGTVSSWGEMLRQGVEHAAVGAWHLWVFPSLALVAVVVGCHRLADRLRED